MANQPDYSPDVPLTAKEVAEVRLRYAQLSRPGLRDAYTEALERCRLDAMRAACTEIGKGRRHERCTQEWKTTHEVYREQRQFFVGDLSM